MQGWERVVGFKWHTFDTWIDTVFQFIEHTSVSQTTPFDTPMHAELTNPRTLLPQFHCKYIVNWYEFKWHTFDRRFDAFFFECRQTRKIYIHIRWTREAHLRWTRDRSQVNWEEFVRYQSRANETYSEAERQFSDRNRDVLMNVQSPHKWGYTLKSAVFGSSSSLPPLVSEGGGLVRESVGKADML